MTSCGNATRLPPVVLDMFSSMPDNTFNPAAREDVLFALGYSLQFGLTGKPHKLTDHQRLAEIQAAYLERSEFVLMRRPGLPPPGVAPSR